MGIKGKLECWVTTALDPVECIKAISLAESLRRTLTSRKLVVVVAPAIWDDEEWWALLNTAFDVCLPIRNSHVSKYQNVPLQMHAKVLCFNLTAWTKIVFLDPNCLALQNGDCIFAEHAWKSDSKPSSLHQPMFIIKPDHSLWTTALENFNEGDWKNASQNGDHLWANSTRRFITSYNFEEKWTPKNYPWETPIVFFKKDQHPLDIMISANSQVVANKGEIEKIATESWMDLLITSTVMKGLQKTKFFEASMVKEVSNNSSPDPTPLDSIAVVGLSFRFPGANNAEEFWDMLLTGQDGIVHVPEGRWKGMEFLMDAETKKTKAGFLKCPIDEFDAQFFNTSPLETIFMDPQQRLTLQVTWEALEDAGINPLSLDKSHTGIFAGSWRTDYKDILNETRENTGSEFFRMYMGNCIGALSGRISHFLGLTGPSISTESGCSSSIVALDLACNSLSSGETDLALACGANMLLVPFSVESMNNIISPEYKCKTFDASADGFVRAEGVAALVLKRYADAVKDGDNIWGLIRGSAVVQEGQSQSMGTPTKYCEALAMKLALKSAGVEPNQVSFVETHGTGTPVGDPLEVAAVGHVYGKNRKSPLTIGSVKTNVGHTESCSAMAGIIKTFLSMKHETIPPHINLTTLNPDINLDAIPAVIPMKSTPWCRKEGHPRIAGVSSFGITGTDGHVIIQEPPSTPKSITTSTPRPFQLLTISAKSEASLKTIIHSYQELLKSNKEDIQDICYTSNIGRAHFNQRVAVVGKDTSDILAKLTAKKFITGQLDANKVTPRICFVFTGQGSQYHNMAKSLYQHNHVFRNHFDQCERILRDEYQVEIREVIWPEKNNNPAHLEKVKRTIYSQTSIFAVEYALLKTWESWGIKPDAVVGHSLGEFAAAVAAGIMDFRAALKLVAVRSRLIDSLPGGKMLVIKANEATVTNLLKVRGMEIQLDFAALNSPDQTVLAGSEARIMEFKELCKNNAIKTHVLEATHAFHSRDMDPILEDYRKAARTITYEPPTCQYISGMDGKVPESPVDSEYWVRHTREPVRFLNASKILMDPETGYSVFLEVGPQPIISALLSVNVDEHYPGSSVKCFPSLKKTEDNWLTMLETVSKLHTIGVEINWKNVNFGVHARKVKLPGYPFQNKRYWCDVGSENKPIHTLVGAQISNPSDTQLFTKSLKSKTADWIKDHMIGSKIIFPGAGFLEMCLAAGHAATSCLDGDWCEPSTPIGIENFGITSPLHVPDNSSVQLQVVVSKDAVSNDTFSTVYSQNTIGSNQWIRHAVGKFTMSATPVSSEKDSSLLTNIKARCENGLDVTAIYDKMPSGALHFGPAFRRLKEAWKGKEEALFLAESLDDRNDYLCHPVIIDAMFQSMMMTGEMDVTKLHVPVHVESLTFFRKCSSRKCYIHLTYPTESDGKKTVKLYDEDGFLVSELVGVTFVETTVDTINGALENQQLCLPPMLEQAFRPVDLAGQKDMSLYPFSQFSIEVLDDNIKSNSEIAKLTEDIYTYYFIKVFRELGWNYVVGTVISAPDFMRDTKVLDGQERLIRYFFLELARDGYFVEIDTTHWRLLKQLLPLVECEQKIDEIQIRLQKLCKFDADYIDYTATNISACITGKENPLAILFPDDKSKPSAEDYYNDCHPVIISAQVASKVVVGLLTLLLKTTGNTDSLRILEVGAGTGSNTKTILQCCKELNVKRRLTYTDISQSFYQSYVTVNEQFGSMGEFKLLNLEQDPLKQGFAPHQYDLVFAGNVIHATRNIHESLTNIRNLLKPGGLLCLQEFTKPLRVLTSSFGLLEGFWRFEDNNIRVDHCSLSVQQWEKAFKDHGLTNFKPFYTFTDQYQFMIGQCDNSSVPMLIDPEMVASSSWLIIENYGEEQVGRGLEQKLCSFGKSAIRLCVTDLDGFKTELLAAIEKIENSNQTLEGIVYLATARTDPKEFATIVRPFMDLCITVMGLTHASPCGLVLFTKGSLYLTDQDQPNEPTPAALHGMIRSFFNESAGNSKVVDLDPSFSGSKEIDVMFSELWTQQEKEHCVAYQDGKRSVARLKEFKTKPSPLPLPTSEIFQLVLPQSKAIQDLRFVPCSKLAMGDHDIEVQVKAYGLNFLDVFAVLKPDPKFDQINSIGLDFAGKVTAIGQKVSTVKVGDSVMGHNKTGKPFINYVVIPAKYIMPVPDTMTYAEAATIPTVFDTAYWCLIEVAKLSKGQVALIHTASGGVGLMAIKVARYVGAEIVATAGSKRKRSFLRSIGIKHIFNSRDTTYEEGIKQALDGRGVDVVLNSLTGPGFKEASINSLKPGGAFIEMSKWNIWTDEEVEKIRPDVMYRIVDLLSLTETEMTKLMVDSSEIISSKKITAIPYVRFDATSIRDALTYLQKAKHIGKVICVMPEDAKTAASTGSKASLIFNDRSTYLITGGLGGIGIEIAKWMARSGAKYLVVTGRNPPNDTTKAEITKLTNEGAVISVILADVGDFNQAEQLISKLKSSPEFPPLRGIMHAAGVISDAMFPQQNWEKYEKTYNAKVRGAWNLHTLTLDCPLEHFVLYSSFVAMVGSMGQSNHASANFFMDQLAHYRNALGLTALSVNWGQWGQVGVAAHTEMTGIKPISVIQATAGLELAMNMHHVQLGIAHIDFAFLRKVLPFAGVYTKEITCSSSSVTDQIRLTIDSDAFYKDFDAQMDFEDKLSSFKRHMKAIVKGILRMDDTDEVDENRNLQDMGMDSLMMVELKNGIQGLIGGRVTLTMNSLKDCHTMNEVSLRIVQYLTGTVQEEAKIVPPTRDEFLKLIHEDQVLPNHIQPSGLPPCKFSESSTLFVTGVSGTLGIYYLRDLICRPSVKEIHCIHNYADKEMDPLQHFLSILTKRQLEINLEKVHFYRGDVTLPNMGLEPEIYDTLTEKCDGVIHLAAQVNMVEFYHSIDSQKHSVRNVNVKGMLNVLEFTVAKRTKNLFHASSLLGDFKTDDRGKCLEAWPSSNDYDELPNFGYPVSKFICERLVDQAIQRGIPVKAFRYSTSARDTQSESSIAIAANQFLLRSVGYIIMGCMPSAPFPVSILPVDVSADITLRIFFNDATPQEVYNVSNPHGRFETELQEIASEMGYKISIVDNEEFEKRLASYKDSPMLHFLKEMFHRRDDLVKCLIDSDTNRMAKFNNRDTMSSGKLVKFIEEYPDGLLDSLQYWKNDLIYAKTNGIIDQYHSMFEKDN